MSTMTTKQYIETSRELLNLVRSEFELSVDARNDNVVPTLTVNRHGVRYAVGEYSCLVGGETKRVLFIFTKGVKDENWRILDRSLDRNSLLKSIRSIVDNCRAILIDDATVQK